MSDARMFSDLIPVSIGDISGVVYATQLTYDIYTNDLIYMSIVGYKTVIDKINDVIIKSRETVGIRARGVYCSKSRTNQYTMDTRKNENSDLVHANIYIKDYHKIVLELNEGKQVHLIGKIDRIDLADTQDGKYIRIIDYKSSKKDFLNSLYVLIIATVPR